MTYRLRDLREDADLNQTQVAGILGMSQTGYSKYETGENDVPTQVLIKLAQFYKTSVDYILGISEQRDPPDLAIKTERYERIRDLREEADLTQEQVCEAIHLPQDIYAYYEGGQRVIPPPVLCALADLYGVSVDYILGRSDDRKNRKQR